MGDVGPAPIPEMQDAYLEAERYRDELMEQERFVARFNAIRDGLLLLRGQLGETIPDQICKRFRVLADRFDPQQSDLASDIDAIIAETSIVGALGLEPAMSGPLTLDGNEPNTPRQAVKGIPQAETNVLVRDWLDENAKINLDKVTRDRIADGTGASKGSVSNSAAWKAFTAERKKRSTSKLREVPLTDEMLAVIPDDRKPGRELSQLDECIRQEQIADFTKQQAEDLAADEKQYEKSRRQTASS